MTRLTQKVTHAAPIIAAVFLIATSGALAQKTETVEGGRTTVTLADSFVSALGSLGVTPGTVSPTELRGAKVNFPITGGAIDLDTGSGQILHSGGLKLTAGNNEVKLQSFIIDTTSSQPVITGLVVANGKLVGRLPLFNLTPASGTTLPLTPSYGVLEAKGIGVTLTATAATALNEVFGITALAGGLEIGTADGLAILARCY
jgi:hypothetical protein